MNLFQAEGSAESNAMFCDLRDRGRSFSSGSANARNVKENHLVIHSKAVGYVRIPAVHVGVEVPEKEQRNPARFAESAVGVTDTIGLNKLRGDRFVCVIAHRLFSFQSDVPLAVLRVKGQHPSALSNPKTASRVQRVERRSFSALCCFQLAG